MCVISVETISVSPGRDYASLSRTVRDAGLLNRRPRYYALTIAGNLGALGAAWATFVLLGDSWWQLPVAAVLAVVYAHMAFVGHDAGHKQIFGDHRFNRAIGVSHGFLVGMSYRWWTTVHNQHHANPNHDEHDPDIDIPVLAFTAEQASARRGLPRWIVTHQAALFFPLLLLEGVNLHVTGVRAALRRDLDRGLLESGLVIAHVAGYLTAVFLVLPPGLGVLFVAVHQGLWGLYMGMCFAPGHKGMPTLSGDVSPDWLRRQVLTSRNISGGRMVDWCYGGLNYQIEHHLFPAMPRPNLRRARPIVRQFCAANGIEYSQAGVLGSYGHVLRHLHATSAHLRTRPAPPG